MAASSIKDLSGKKTWGCLTGSSSEQWLKIHYVHKTLAASLCVDLSDRGFELSEIESADSIFLDEPGMIFQNRPLENLKIDSLKIVIPSEDVGSILQRLWDLEERSFKDGAKYYKLKTWNVCLVLTVKQKEVLEQSLENLLDKAEKKADAFYADFVKMMGPHDGEIN